MDEHRQIVKAMVAIQRPSDRALLVSEHAHPQSGAFHRPLGGHVEFGEYALDAAHRELREETGQDLTDVRLLSVLENIFQWNGAVQHEVVFVYAAGFADPAAYEIAEQGILDDCDGQTRVLWRAAEATSPPLYPAGLGDLIAQVL